MAFVLVLIGVLHWVLIAFLALLTLRAVLSWVPLFVRDWEPRGALRILSEFVLTVTDPPIRLARRVLPPLRIGDLLVDTAFLVVYLAVVLLSQWL